MSIPPLALTQERAARLLAYIQAYRRHLLTQITPSAERNTHQRLLQALQGKLIHESAQPAVMYHFSLTGEEIAVLKTMAADLLTLTVREPETDQRNATLIDLSVLKAALEKLAFYGLSKSSPFWSALVPR